MKKSIYIILPLVLITVSCSKDFLNISPEHFQNANNYYKTPDQFIKAVTGAYSPLQGLYTGSAWILSEMRSDNTSYHKNTIDASGFPREELDEFREQDDNSVVYGFFNGSYNGIARCNTVLQRLQQATIDQATKDQVEGQATFLRAFYYFGLVRLFGDIPLSTEEVTSTGEAFAVAAKRPVADIYAQIITDAQMAISKLPVSWTAAKDKGRATKAAAETLLAKVYMTRKEFDKVIPLLRSVMQAPNAFNLQTNYADIFKLANKNGVESIFEIQYMEGSVGESSDFIYSFAPYNAGTSVTGFALYTGSGSGWNIPTQDMLNAYEPTDVRKAASINQSFTDPGTGKVVPYVSKYNTPHGVRFQTASNFPVYRFADVLLMLAESLNEVAFTPNGEAYTLLNRVRQRAQLLPKTAGNPDPALDVSTQDAFRQAVWKERQVELAFENHRWFDLLRTGKAAEVIQAHGAREKALKAYINPVAYSNIRLTYQYPRREVQLVQ